MCKSQFKRDQKKYYILPKYVLLRKTRKGRGFGRPHLFQSILIIVQVFRYSPRLIMGEVTCIFFFFFFKFTLQILFIYFCVNAKLWSVFGLCCMLIL